MTRALPAAVCALTLSLTLSLAWAWATPFWFDEIFTVRIAALPDAPRMWDALRNGPELNPPLHYFAVRAAGATGQITARLPSALGVALGCFALTLFAARRFGPAAGLAAGFTPLVTIAFRYSYEARPYGLMFGASALTLLAWQGATSNQGSPGRARRLWLALLALSLSAALLSHCYAILLYLPLAVGELVRLRQSRRIDWPLIVAITLPAACVVTYIPLLAGSRELAANSWAAPSLDRLAGSYLVLVQPSAWPLILVIVALTLTRRATVILPAHELAAALALLALPLAAFLFGLAFTGFFHARYAVASSAGAALLLSTLAARRPACAPCILAAGAITACLLAVQARSQNGPPYSRTAPTACRLDDSRLPIAVADGLLFLPLTFYADDALAPRLHFLMDRGKALRYTRNDSIELGLAALARHIPLNVPSYAAFIKAHPRFLIVGSRHSEMTWLRRQLESEGAHIAHIPGCDTSHTDVDWALVTRP